ncbi:MAG: DUF4249 domain-containing protein [Reichenbachiella sp.]
MMKQLFLLAFGMLLIGCIEPYDFQTDEAEKVLVIEGGITNQAKAHVISLTYSYSLDSGANATVLNDAILKIESREGEVESLTGIGNGDYITRDDFAAVVGQEYRLLIQTTEENYASTYEILLGAPEIVDIYGTYTELPNEDTNEVEGGVQIFLDVFDPSGNTNYYRYEYDDTYRIDVPFPSSIEVLSDSIYVYRQDGIGTCYTDDFSSSLIVGTSINSLDNRLVEFPIRYVSGSSQLLRSRLSMLTRQFAISENAYSYYRKLEDNRNSSGSLFDMQLGSVSGNIYSTSGKNEIVLGYFEVAGITERRDFFSQTDFGDEFERPEFAGGCELPSPMEAVAAAGVVWNNPSFEIFAIASKVAPFDPDSAYLMYRKCTSCNWYADTTPPDFWIEEE